MSENGKKIIFPEGDELKDYLNKGYPICNKCGAVMYQREDPEGGCDILTCPACGWEIDELEYEYESDDKMKLVEDELGNEFLIYKPDLPPPGCRACGGPYPYCKEDCRMYDD